MSANETLAEVYRPELRQLVGVDGEFWRHAPCGNWEWVCKFNPHPGPQSAFFDYQEPLKVGKLWPVGSSSGSKAAPLSLPALCGMTGRLIVE
jgi:hypothetical protein